MNPPLSRHGVRYGSFHSNVLALRASKSLLVCGCAIIVFGQLKKVEIVVVREFLVEIFGRKLKKTYIGAVWSIFISYAFELMRVYWLKNILSSFKSKVDGLKG